MDLVKGEWFDLYDEVAVDVVLNAEGKVNYADIKEYIPENYKLTTEKDAYEVAGGYVYLAVEPTAQKVNVKLSFYDEVADIQVDEV